MRTLLFLALATAASAQHKIDFVGGGVDGDTQALAMVPRGCRPSGDRIKWVARRENGSLNSGQREDERRTAPMSPWLSTISSAGSIPARLHQNPGWWQRHLGDTAIHLGATSADAATSWGRVELHPMLRSADGRFGARGLALKFGIFGAVELAKWRLAKRYPRERWVRVLSLGPAAAFGGVAVRNWSVR